MLLGKESEEGGLELFSYARSCEIDEKSDVVEVASPTSARAREYIAGRTSWTMRCECLLAKDESVVEGLFRSGEAFWVQCRHRDNTGCRYRGKAFITSLRTTGRLHDMATYSIGLQGTGELEYA